MKVLWVGRAAQMGLVAVRGCRMGPLVWGDWRPSLMAQGVVQLWQVLREDR